MKKNKKVDVKAQAKKEIMAIVTKALADAGYAVTAGEAYGMTSTTIVVGHDTCDVQIKPITPKAGNTRYEIIPDEE